MWLVGSFFVARTVDINGAPGASRTRGTRIRNPLLYPSELQGQPFFIEVAAI